ncbi:MAG: hypothetical protein ABI823_11920 [Bryobacteraceae bacterium]
MFAVEIVVFILGVIVLSTRGLWNAYALGRNERRRKQAMSTLLDPMVGQPITDAVERFGQPAEYVGGTTGRGLYIWLSPPAKRFPKGRGVLVVTLTADPDGVITAANWAARAS